MTSPNTPIFTSAMLDQNLSSREKALLIFLWSCRDPHTALADPSNTRMVSALGIAKRTLQSSLKTLNMHGYVVDQEREIKENRQRLLPIEVYGIELKDAGFCEIPSRIIQESSLSAEAICLYAYYSLNSNKEGTCSIKQDVVMADLGMGWKALASCFRMLEAGGHITRHRTFMDGKAAPQTITIVEKRKRVGLNALPDIIRINTKHDEGQE